MRRKECHLQQRNPCTAADPLAGRAGLVGTQNVRSNASRIGGLDHITSTGTLVDAVDNQPWSGEANVHVSIVNWVKTQDPKLLPKVRRLWFKASPKVGVSQRRKGTGPASKQYELDMREVPFITSSLSDKVDVTGALALACNESIVVCQGITPGHKGFVIKPVVKASMIATEPKNAAVVHPWYQPSPIGKCLAVVL